MNSDGSITFNAGPPTGLTTPTFNTINTNALLLGGVARPIDNLRITGDFEFGYNDFAFTRTSPRQVQSYRISANYKPKPWGDINGAVDIHENRDNVFTVNNLEHDRMYSFTTILMPNKRLSVDFGTTTGMCSRRQLSVTRKDLDLHQRARRPVPPQCRPYRSELYPSTPAPITSLMQDLFGR